MSAILLWSSVLATQIFLAGISPNKSPQGRGRARVIRFWLQRKGLGEVIHTQSHNTRTKRGSHDIFRIPYQNPITYVHEFLDKAVQQTTSSIYYLQELVWDNCSSGERTSSVLRRNTPVVAYSSIYSSDEIIINTSYQKLPFGSGDYPDKLLFHQALN